MARVVRFTTFLSQAHQVIGLDPILRPETYSRLSWGHTARTQILANVINQIENINITNLHFVII